ncbi:MAG: hypothetical protein AAFV30_09295 [Pseudomonadota bacterium]
MKHITHLALLATLASAPALADGVIDEKDWTETFDVGGNPSLTIDNIWGNISIKPGPSDEIAMSIRSVRTADDAVNFERSLELIPLRIAQEGDDVYLRVGRDHERQWWNDYRCDGCRLHVDLEVTVPANTALDVKTVNDGDVRIWGVEGRVTAANVNGSITTKGVTQCTHVETINGDVEVTFTQSPSTDCRIETLNGDIALDMAPGADANLAVSLFNGKILSEVDLAPREMAATVERRTKNGRNHYDIEQLAGLRLGRGGKTLTLKSLNGDVLVARSQ